MRTITLEVFLLFLVHPKGSLTDGTKELFFSYFYFFETKLDKERIMLKKMFGMKLARRFYSLAINNKLELANEPCFAKS